jgi:hypothetical protein
MGDQETLISKKRRGPAPSGQGTPVMVRLQPNQLAALDAWIEADGSRFSRPEAIRRLLEHAWENTVASRGVQPQPPRLKELD